MEELIRAFSLLPHPEGGFYRETYRAAPTVPGTNRGVSTAIYYLLGRGQRSTLHRIDADELWHFYRGDPLVIVELVEGGAPRLTTLSVERPQHVVNRGTWFGAMPAEGSAWCFVGCTVAPAFEFEHFELGRRGPLLAAYPHAHEVICALTPG